MAGVQRNGPCPTCGCGPVCEIVIDPATTDGTANYTAVSGTLTHFSNHYRSTSANGIFIHNTAGTTGHGRVTIRAQQSVNGGISRLIGSYVDSSNYVFAELTHSSTAPEFKLWKRVAGTNTQIGETFFPVVATTGTYYNLELCWNGTYAVATFATSSTTTDIVIGGPYSGTGNKAGFGGHPNGSTGLYDDFEFYKHSDDDSACLECARFLDCGACNEGTVPIAVAVTFTGMANGTLCSSCSYYNATFILFHVAGTDPCLYSPGADFSPPVGCVYSFRFEIDPTNEDFEVGLSGTHILEWVDAFTSPIDCEAELNSRDMGSLDADVGTTRCDGTGVTVIVDAVL